MPTLFITTQATPFDFDDFCEHYGINILGVKGDVWHIVQDCLGVGYRHENSFLTAFRWDGSNLGWSCFAQGCPTHGLSIGQLISFLNQTHPPYKGVIWDREEEDEQLGAKWKVQFLNEDEEEAAPVVESAPVEVKPFVIEAEDFDALMNGPSVDVASAYDYTQGMAELAKELKWDGTIAISPEELMPKPDDLSIADPEARTGLVFLSITHNSAPVLWGSLK